MNNTNEDSHPMSFDSDVTVRYQDFSRLERKVDRLTDALNKLVLIEDRQVNQFKLINDATTEIGKLEVKFASLKEEGDRWKNRALGAWAAVGALGTAVGWLISNHIVR